MTERAKSHKEDRDGMADAAGAERERRRLWRTEGEPSMMKYVGQIGILGWTIVTPTLAGLFAGRWLDQSLHTGIFWSAPLMMLGVALGCWSAWRWMHKP